MTTSAETKESWLNWMALSTVVLAVCATLSTFKAGGYSTQTVIFQSQASDQWAYFQAKSIKSSLVELQMELLNVDASRPGITPAQRDVYTKAIATHTQDLSRYKSEKDEIKTHATQLEAERDTAKGHGRPFGLAVMFLQVGILISSIAGLLKKKTVWYCSTPISLTGVTLFLSGFFGFIPLSLLN